MLAQPIRVRGGRLFWGVKAGDTCPYCKAGEVVKRSGKFGDFFACSQFPHCGFTERIPVKKDED